MVSRFDRYTTVTPENVDPFLLSGDQILWLACDERRGVNRVVSASEDEVFRFHKLVAAR